MFGIDIVSLIVVPGYDGIQIVKFRPGPRCRFCNGKPGFIAVIIVRHAPQICHQVSIRFSFIGKFSFDDGGIAGMARIPGACRRGERDALFAEKPLAVLLFDALAVAYIVHDHSVVQIGAVPNVQDFPSVFRIRDDGGAVIIKFSFGHILPEQDSFKIHRLRDVVLRFLLQDDFDGFLEIDHVRSHCAVRIYPIFIGFVLKFFGDDRPVVRINRPSGLEQP